MPRELPTYRDNIVRLNGIYSDREQFTLEDLCTLTGLSCRTVKELFVFSGNSINRDDLARKLAWVGRDYRITIAERYNGRMPISFDLYEDNLKRLDEKIPDRELLTKMDICRFTGLSSGGVETHFPFAGKYICKVNFAHMLAKLGQSPKKQGE